MSWQLRFVAVLAAFVLATACGPAQAANLLYSSYEAAMGGWDYCLTGDQAIAGTPAGFNSLDGTWDYTNPSSSWDLSAPGAGSPGGVGTYTDLNDGTQYLRIQDAGDAPDHGFPSPANANIYLARQVGSDTQLLDNGVTISFRARVPMAATATEPLDDWYMDSGSVHAPTPLAPLPWPPLSMDPRRGGAGDIVASGGKGMFGIWQSSGLNDEGRDYGKLISFSLAVGNPTHADTSRGNINYGNGLIMNSRNGNVPKDTVDPDQDEGIINILPITETDVTPDDLDQWHEFWITIEPVTAPDATHAVTIWVDGLLTGSRFLVTAGDAGQSPDYKNVPPFFGGATTTLDNAIFLGSVGSRAAGTQDVDFFCVKAGVHPIPEPSSMALFGLVALFGLLVLRTKR